jgi:hypothetical protein
LRDWLSESDGLRGERRSIDGEALRYRGGGSIACISGLRGFYRARAGSNKGRRGAGTVQMAGVVDAKLTARPEVAVAESVSGVPHRLCSNRAEGDGLTLLPKIKLVPSGCSHCQHKYESEKRSEIETSSKLHGILLRDGVINQCWCKL